MTPLQYPSLRRRLISSHRFWLVNLALLLIFGWTLGEQTRLRIEVRDGHCTAVLPERSIPVACGELGETRVGLFSVRPPATLVLLTRPWEAVMPADSWSSVRAWDADGGLLWQAAFGDGNNWQSAEGKWQIRAGEAQSRSERGLLLHRETISGDFILEVDVRRAEDGAGIWLQSADGSAGWLFLVSGKDRRGAWWSWHDEQPARPLVGAPFQKPFPVQLQDLLRAVLKAHQAALLILLLAAGIGAAFDRSREQSGRNDQEPFLRLPASHERYVIAGAVLLVFGLSLHVATSLLEGVPHVQDSITYHFQAQTLAEGRLWAPAPPLPEFFEQEFLIVQDGRWFGKYPPGFPATLALGVALGAPWLVNPLLAALTVPLLAVLAWQLYGRSTTTPALLLMAFSPFVLGLSGSMMAHAAELFWISLFLVAWSRALALGRRWSAQATASRPGIRTRWAALAGVALGVGLLIRQPAALAMGIGFGGATLLLFGRSYSVRHWLRAVVVASVGVGLALVILLGYQYVLTGNALQDPRLLFWRYDSVGFGQDLGQGQNAFRYEQVGDEAAVTWYRDPEQPPRGHTPQRGVFNLQRNWEALVGQLYGWPILLTLAFGWLVFITPDPSRADVALLAAAAALMAFQVFYWADGIMYGPRYLYAALPAFILLTARGFGRLAELVGPRTGRLLAGLLLLALVGGNLLFYLPGQFDAWRGFNFVDRGGLDLVEAQALPPAVVFVDTGAGDWWEYGRVFSANTPWLDGPINYARDLGPTENRRLLATMPDRRGYRLTPDGLQPIPQD